MKKTLLLLASAALLLVGCAKEKFAEPGVGGLTDVTISACLDGGVATKAFADGDGKGLNVNRCIMEIYFQDQLYKRMEAAMSGTPATATFANVPVVAGKEYQILFWADCGGAEKADLYYTTTNLKTVTVAKTAFLAALAAGENDKLDAFYFADNYTVPQAGGNYNANLKRPFAQLNVITTDVAEGKTVTSADLLPEKVSVSYSAAKAINVATGEISGTETYAYEAPVYGTWSDTTELTLSMDYILASTEQGTVDVTFKTKNGDAVVMTHSLANLPYQRNYRTNVKGDLLTTGGTWTATIAPAWTGTHTHPVVIATTLEEAQAAVGPATAGAEAAGTVIVKPEAVTNRDQSKDKTSEQVITTTPGIALPEGAKAIEFVLTPQSQKDVTFELPALPSGNFYWYIRHEDNYPTKNLNVKVSENDKTRVIIDAPNDTHVELNDVEYEHVIAITGDNTLVVPQGIKVDKLTVKKGGVEIHGTVVALEVLPEEGKNVYFRSSENLSSTVFDVIKGEGHNYIDTPQYSEKLNSDGTYDIVSSVCKIGETYYGSLDDAFKAVPTDAAKATVITVVADANETFDTSGAQLNKGQKVILDLNGYKLVGTSTESGYTQYIYVENGAELTVKDSRTGGAIEYHDAYIENLTSGSGTGGSAITCHGCVTLESGTIENKTPDTKTNDLEGAIDMYTNAWGQAYSPADIVLNINGGVVKSNNANTVRLTSFSAQSYTTSVTVNMNGGEVYGRDGFFIQGVSESYLNTNTLNLNCGKVYGTQAVRVMAWQNHENASESKPVTITIREGVDIKNNYFAQSTKTGWSEGICIDNLSGTFEQLLSYVDIKKIEYKTTLLRDNEVFGQYETIADAVWAFNYDPAITAGNYTLNIKPGTYNEDMILFIQDKTEGKYRTLLVQSADPTQKVVVKSTSAMKAVFGIAAESDYSGGPISFKNIDIDVTENTNSEAYPVYFAGSQSGTPDLIFPEPSTSYNRRYAHNVSFDNCNIIGNGTSQAFVTSTGTGGIKVENCEITDCVMGFNGYMVALHVNLSYGLHVKNVRFDGGTFINDQSAGASEVSVEDCTIKCNRDYAIRTSGSSQVLGKFDYQFVIKNTTIEVDGAELDKDAGVIYFRSTETHALIENCTVTKKNITCKDNGQFTLYDIYNKPKVKATETEAPVIINGKTLNPGPGVGMEWLNEPVTE